MSTFWALFSQHFFPAKIKCSKSALTDRKVQNVRSTFSAQYGVTKLRTSISCGWRTPNEVLQVAIVPHVSNAQYFLAKVLSGNYCALLTCDTMVPVVLRLECGCTKYSQKVIWLTVLRLRTISGGYGSTSFSALSFGGKKKSWEKSAQKVLINMTDRKAVRQQSIFLSERKSFYNIYCIDP